LVVVRENRSGSIARALFLVCRASRVCWRYKSTVGRDDRNHELMVRASVVTQCLKEAGGETRTRQMPARRKKASPTYLSNRSLGSAFAPSFHIAQISFPELFQALV